LIYLPQNLERLLLPPPGNCLSQPDGQHWSFFWESGYAGGVGRMGSSDGGNGGEREEAFTGRAAVGYDYGYDGEVFYLGLALDPAYVEGFVEGCLERIGEEDPDEEQLFWDLWEDEGERETVL
jgi:hypothetical protein